MLNEFKFSKMLKKLKNDIWTLMNVKWNIFYYLKNDKLVHFVTNLR